MNHDEEYLAKLAPDIGTAAAVLKRQFQSLEYDDIYQDLWVYVMERKKPLKTREENGRPIDFLVQAGRRICGQEIESRIPRSDEYSYTPRVVREMLDAGMLLFTDTGDPTGMIDLVEAFSALSDVDKARVVSAFRDNNPEYRQPGGKSKRLSEAIRKLSMEMNRVSERRSDWHIEREISGYIGSRKTMNQTLAEY